MPEIIGENANDNDMEKEILMEITNLTTKACCGIVAIMLKLQERLIFDTPSYEVELVDKAFDRAVEDTF